MTKPAEISNQMRQALMSAASTHTIDGPRGRALSVIRVGLDRRARYIKGRHVMVVQQTQIKVAHAVDLANEVLEQAGLHDYRIDYPGARFESGYIHGANDNFAAAHRRFDVLEGA